MLDNALNTSAGHAHPGQVLAGEGIVPKVGIDDGLGRRQHCARQVVIGHQYLHPGGLSGGNPLMAGYAVVHRHDQVRSAFKCSADDLGREPVTVFEAVGHQELDLACAQGAQRPHAQDAAGRAVGVEITDDQDATVTDQRTLQQSDRRGQPAQLLRPVQAVQGMFQFLRPPDPARGIDAAQHGRQAVRQLGGVDLRLAADDAFVSEWMRHGIDVYMFSQL
ncbi:MAG TPA: hypothetical protein VK971_07375 [Thiohalobacter sp.]|nr:hypothetical protein [Thiohalobacter sp.]